MKTLVTSLLALALVVGATSASADSDYPEPFADALPMLINNMGGSQADFEKYCAGKISRPNDRTSVCVVNEDLRFAVIISASGRVINAGLITSREQAGFIIKGFRNHIGRKPDIQGDGHLMWKLSDGLIADIYTNANEVAAMVSAEKRE